eukprot:Tamp_15163.p1 GENE.Tamp_15163~~Tamp_15163.p1  ORF type:complete len:373 (-),score=59.99 Tamp_15163:445-1434(-)
MAAGSADAALAALGYAFVPGPSGRASDWVMRNKDDASKGFEWRGQEDYDAVGAAVCGWVRSRLTSACGLEEVSAGLEPATAYASPGWRTHAGPFLLLVCGSKPGGTAGVWGRALCINATTHEGAMFDYIARGHAKGWAVLVADPHADECPHRHLVRLVDLLPAAGPLLIVGHSYGAAMSLGMLKASPGAQARLKAIALTDGMRWSPTGWVASSLLHETVPSEEEVMRAAEAVAEDKRGMHLKSLHSVRARLLGYAELTPAAFQPPTAELLALVAAVGQNWISSAAPLDTPENAEDGACMPAVSAGHESHPSTTHAATESVFAFLLRKLA